MLNAPANFSVTQVGPVNHLGPESGNFMELAVGLLITALPIVLSIGVPVYLGFRFLRAYERRGRSMQNAGDSDARVAALEAEVALLAQQVEQMRKGQQFDAALREGLPRARAIESTTPHAGS